MATGEGMDPCRSFKFQLEIDEVPLGTFSEVSGLSAEGDAVDYRESTDKQSSLRKLPGLCRHSNLALKRGYTQAKSLWNWYANILNGVPDRRNVTVVLMNGGRQPVLTSHADNACVNKIEGPSSKASGVKGIPNLPSEAGVQAPAGGQGEARRPPPSRGAGCPRGRGPTSAVAGIVISETLRSALALSAQAAKPYASLLPKRRFATLARSQGPVFTPVAGALELPFVSAVWRRAGR